MGLAFQGQEGHLVKSVRQLGILLDLPEDHVGHLGNAGDKELDVPLFLVLGILPVILHDAVLGRVCEQLLAALLALAGEFCDLLDGLGLAQTHFQHDFRDLVVGAGPVQDDVLRISFG